MPYLVVYETSPVPGIPIMKEAVLQNTHPDEWKPEDDRGYRLLFFVELTPEEASKMSPPVD